MKKIDINKNNNLLEISKIIKEKLPDKKVFLYKNNKKIIIKIPKNINPLFLEELKTTIKVKFLDHEVSFQYFG